MRQPSWTKDYDVNTIVLNSHKRLGLTGLLNILQDIAWLHAEHLGWGYEDLIKRNTIWVLVRQKLVMNDWPVWGDVVTIRTWPRGVAGVLALRDFEIFVRERKLGECTTSWLTLNWKTRRPQKIDPATFMLEDRPASLSFEAEKIALRTDLNPVARFVVRYSDLDVNGHVNNTRYAQWIVDTATMEETASLQVAAYEVNFINETRVGDEVVIDRGEVERPADAPAWCQFQGRRTSDDKVLFAAKVSTRRI
ncbi:MAG TPA: acyl-ACP thioesterase domain-containing protein [Rhizomicrobium sp.]|nr:acyl-ACP thioesterase domain-containing protein [Rhizomicrobium sp.]